MSNLKSFTLFPSLPTELRLKIYQEITFSTPQILKISYSPSLTRYISNTPPPLTLSICHESRLQTLLTYTYLSLGPSPTQAPTQSQLQKLHHHTGASSPYQRHFPSLSEPQQSILKSKKDPLPKTSLSIPINFTTQILYISSLSPLLNTLQFQHTFLFHLSTSPSRHLIRDIAMDFRVWNELCEHGFLGVLARMKGLMGVRLVVEFGRMFKGDLDWLEAPEYRKDLNWVAKTATRDIERVREGIRGKDKSKTGAGVTPSTNLQLARELGTVVEVQCVILTRGGEQA